MLKKKDPRYTDEQRQDIIKRYESGETLASLAKALGKDKSTLGANLRRWGVSLRKSGPEDKWTALSQEQWDDTYKRYENGESLKSLALERGSERHVLSKQLKKRGYKVPLNEARRTHTVNDDYFETVDTEEKAYWLGFLMADGCVKQSGRTVDLCLQPGDIGHLEKFKKALGSNVIMRYMGKDKKYPYININSTKLVVDLSKHGCVYGKTCTHATPNIPEELYRHYFRGLIDGDGSILPSSDKRRISVYLVGGLKPLVDFKEWLSQQDVSVSGINNKGKADRLYITKHAEACKTVYCLYHNAAIYLDRKMAVAQHYVHDLQRG